MKELRVNAIKEGTVIDHIPPKVAFKIAETLQLKNSDKEVVVATNFFTLNLDGKKKGLVKIADRTLSQRELDKISLLVPGGTINIIKNYEVVKKDKIKMPKELINTVRCLNPNCITNKDRIKTKFTVIKEEPLELNCCYCERTMHSGDISLL